MSRRMSVDLPEPVEPTRNTNSPRRTEKVTSSRPVVAARVELGDAAELDDHAGAAGARAARRGLASGLVSACGRRHGCCEVSRSGPSFPARDARCKRRLQAARLSSYRMPQITSSTPAERPARCTASPSRARAPTTILVAFDAGARTERPEENGMAHFLEHLVFKGGEKYDDYRKVNETAERMGGSLNAYTSTTSSPSTSPCRAEAAMEAIDLLTDFVGRPRIDAGELDQRARRRHPGDPALQGPAVGGRRGAHRPRRVRRPPARAHRARPRGAPARRSRATRSSPSASAAGRASAAARSSSATSSTCPANGAVTELLRALPDAARRPSPTSPRRRSSRARSSRSATPTSRTCG